jgi:hypothetical protein
MRGRERGGKRRRREKKEGRRKSARGKETNEKVTGQGMGMSPLSTEVCRGNKKTKTTGNV